jgi:hypothetical protein
VHWFASLEDATQKIDAFRWDYNENHPHRALKGLSPNEYAPASDDNGRRLTVVAVRKTRSPHNGRRLTVGVARKTRTPQTMSARELNRVEILGRVKVTSWGQLKTTG